MRDKNKTQLSLNHLQNEIDDMIEKCSPDQTNKEIERTIVNELSRVLPKNEKITASNSGLIVRNTAGSHRHSPFVLDLNAMVREKRKKLEKKKKVSRYLKTASKKNPRAKKQKTSLKTEGKLVSGKLTNSKKIKEYENQFTKDSFFSFHLPVNWKYSLVLFSTVCFLLIVPINVAGYYKNIRQSQKEAASRANNAYEDLKIAGRALADNDLLFADEHFSDAKYNFSLAKNELDNINSALQVILKIIPADSANLADAEYLLNAGEKISSLGQKLTETINGFAAANGETTVKKLEIFRTNLQPIIDDLDATNNYLNKIRPEAIPEEKREQFSLIKQSISLLLNDLNELNSLSNTFFHILGKDYQRRYLFVFQNNNEIRATGGFLGSFALVDIDQGEIKNIEIPGGGTYDLQGSLREKKISPEPMHLVNALWQMQDANWFPDFPTSAQKIKWFFEKSGGPTVDGVIAINASMIPRLLSTAGAIEMPEYGKTLTAANFIEETQKAVEFEYDKTENKPKQILSDMAPKLIEKIFSAKGQNLLDIMKTFKLGLNEKEIQFYFTNAAVEEKITSYNWGGEIKDSTLDYLSVINTNIRGYKTDGFIKQNINLVSDINSNGEIINRLTIERKHTGDPNDVFGKESNIDYLRVYVPAGSELLSASGFGEIPADKFEAPEDSWEADEFLAEIQGEIYIDPKSGTSINNEFNKTVFGNWIQTDAGETKLITIKYKLPFTFKLPEKQSIIDIIKNKDNETFYSLFIQKQSGGQNINCNVSINLPAGLSLKWLYPSGLTQNQNLLNYNTPLNQDELIGLVVE
ncbi:DUF4012 domain-containing protein [Patescibacteria group bacterium]|nr:DUF4012 domain-containing protein [Patescibacteria group bacterium]